MAEKPFEPGPGMRRYAVACADPDVEPSPEARRAAAGVSARQVARWRKKAEFAEWLDAEVRRHLTERMWEVWVVVFRSAREGNLTAAKLLTDRLAPDGAGDEEGPMTFHQLGLLAREAESEEDEEENL